MVIVREKVIHKSTVLYAERSFRLPDGSVRKTSKYIKSREEAMSAETKAYFLGKEAQAQADYAIKNFGTDAVFDENTVMMMEAARTGYREIMRRLSDVQRSDLLDRFTVNFTYESNAIEGNSLTLKDVTLVLHEDVVPAGKPLREVYETRNTREANDELFKGNVHITPKDILRVHAILTKDTGVAAGWKKAPNFLLMRDVKTTQPEQVENEMQALVDEYHKDTRHPLRRAAAFHERFERIHPFEDGNGRTGRLLVNAILLEHGYPPLIIRKTTRTAYFNALEAADNNHPLKIERFFVERFKETFEKFFKVYVRYI